MTKRVIALSVVLLAAVATMAQEAEGSVAETDNTAVTEGAWYSSPWLWVLGAAIILIILLSLTRGGSRSTEYKNE